MTLAIGADHRGYALKEKLISYLGGKVMEVKDLGNTKLEPGDDYPDFAVAVGKWVAEEPDARKGIAICGSGVGVAIAANKLPRIRAGLAMTPEMAKASRNDENTNVLVLAADFTDEKTVREIIDVWLETPFSEEERHKRRIGKITALEPFV